MSFVPLNDLSSYWPIALALLAFAALGFQRGWVREVTSLGTILAAWLLIVTLGPVFVGWANKLALMLSFTWQGGFDVADPTAVMQTLRAAPMIDPWRPEWFYSLIFLVGVAGAYLIGNRVAGRTRTTAEAVLGGLVGALNGFVVSYILLDYFRTASHLPGRTTAVVDGSAFLGGYITTVLVAGVIGAVSIAMLSSSRGSAAARPKRAGRSSG